MITTLNDFDEFSNSSRITNQDDFSKLDPELIKSFIQAWTNAISGRKVFETIPETEKAFVTFLHQQIDKELEGHLEYLAKKQNVELKELPALNFASSIYEELRYLQILASNINKVQNNQNGGITTRISRELNGMDCSMSTWVMQHEIRKTKLNFEYGAPIGHAIGIVTLSNNEVYYVDGQNGFVEKIEIETIPLVNSSKILKIINYKEIQSKQPRFFPEHVFVSPNNDVISTMSNIDSMLYKQYTKELTEEEKINLGNDAKIVEQMQPYAREFLAIMNESNKATNENKEAINKIQDTLFPEINEFRESNEAKKDIARLHSN